MVSIGDIVGGCASLAALLEVSSYPKPGNVHRTRDHKDTRYEHFLAGSVSLGRHMGKLAKGDRLGELIYQATIDMLNWQRGGNVHLGIILLFAPISAAAGRVMENGVCDIKSLRASLHDVIREGTTEDSLNIYKAIDFAMSNENLGSVDKLDVTDESASQEIINDELTPLDIFEECRERDMICHEWVTDFETVFTESYPYLKDRIDSGADINESTRDTFIKLLGDHPDSLIRRKKGQEEAQNVSEKAALISKETSPSKKLEMISKLDDELSIRGGKLNPGTTADLTAASLFLLLLTGWRP